MDLTGKRCVPCEGGIPKLGPEASAKLLEQLNGWEVRGDRLTKTMVFPDFRAAMAYLNRAADLAEDEGHHPDFCVHYREVTFTLWTHAVGGLSENDFVLAAKLDALRA